MAGIVIKSDFVQAGSPRAFSQYINYINRKEKVGDIKFTGYFDYVDRDRTTFTADLSVTSEEEILAIKQTFQLAQEQGSNLWRSYISFDHEFLKECGVIEDDMIDDLALQNMTKRYMESIVQSEGIKSAYWVGAIHYDTDNIHVHTSLVQTEPDREKGKFQITSLEKAKSVAVTTLDQSHQVDTIRLNDLLRNQMLERRMGKTISTIPTLVSQYHEIFESLPEDKRLWKYSMNALASVRPAINQFIDDYLNKVKPDEVKEFNELLDKLEARSKTVYGETNKSYAENKRNDMYSRMGNALLKDMAEYAKEINSSPLVSNRSEGKKPELKEETPFGVSRELLHEPIKRNEAGIKLDSENKLNHRTTLSQYKRMHYYLNDEWEHIKNEIVYDQLQKNIEVGE